MEILLVVKSIKNGSYWFFFKETEPKVETKFTFRELDLAKDNSILDPTRFMQSNDCQSVSHFSSKNFLFAKNEAISGKFEKPKHIK